MEIDGINKTDYQDPELENTIFKHDYTFKDIVGMLEYADLNIASVQRTLGFSIAHRLRKEQWCDYLQKKYPLRFSNLAEIEQRTRLRARERSKAVNKKRKNESFFATTLLECMEEDCSIKFKFIYERAEGIPKIRKRCPACSQKASRIAAGCFDQVRQQIKR